MAKKQKSILDDPRWQEFSARYRHDWLSFAIEVCGREPTHQQLEIIESCQREGQTRTSVSSGHGTGKSDIAAVMILAFMTTYEMARTVLVANKLGQVQIGIFKYIKDHHWPTAINRFPWLADYFEVTDTMFYCKQAKNAWSTAGKGYRLGNEEALAGEHAEHLWYIVDEASGLSDKAFGVIGGALTQEDNRLLLISQPTRPSGYFYDTHHSLAGGKTGFTAIKLNSELSPLVTPQFIAEKYRQYGFNRDAYDYLVKVRGEFPTVISGMLIGRHVADVVAAKNFTMRFPKQWGWVACCDVGNGRDKSVLSIFRVFGEPEQRLVYPYRIQEFEGDITPLKFADKIIAECSTGQYPNITVCIDADGVGSSVVEKVEQANIEVQEIHWGLPMHSDDNKKRFRNQRAYANVMAKYAVEQRRLKIDSQATVEQAVKLPYFHDEQGRWCMEKKTTMREKHNIKSPDRWDTYCFAFLADYTPAMTTISASRQAQIAQAAAELDS